LLLSLTPNAGAVVGHLRYDSALFEAATIARMGSHFETLVQAIVDDPDRPCSRLPLVGEEERAALLVHGTRTERDYPRDARVHELFAAQAARTPDAIAVVCGDRSLTYRALDERANQLAWFLRRAGVGAETPVALLVERSLEMIVGVLGVLKAGGAYVPLDSAAPADRLRFLLRDAGAPVILTQAHLAARVPEVPGKLVRLDTDWAEIAAEPDTPPADETTAESLAAMMYTSGSTGRPKGVSVPHRAIVRLVVSTTYVRWGADEVFLQLAPLAFDASTFEIWGSPPRARLRCSRPARSPGRAGRTLVSVTTLWLTAVGSSTASAREPGRRPSTATRRRGVAGPRPARPRRPSAWSSSTATAHRGHHLHRVPPGPDLACSGPASIGHPRTPASTSSIDTEHCPVGVPGGFTSPAMIPGAWNDPG
jgi:non-ribosomal peptide synthetase component F